MPMGRRWKQHRSDGDRHQWEVYSGGGDQCELEATVYSVVEARLQECLPALVKLCCTCLKMDEYSPDPEVHNAVGMARAIYARVDVRKL